MVEIGSAHSQKMLKMLQESPCSDIKMEMPIFIHTKYKIKLLYVMKIHLL